MQFDTSKTRSGKALRDIPRRFFRIMRIEDGISGKTVRIGCQRRGRFIVAKDRIAFDGRIRGNPALPDAEAIHFPHHAGRIFMRDVKVVIRPDVLMNIYYFKILRHNDLEVSGT